MTSTETIVHLTSKNEKRPGPQAYYNPVTIGSDAPKYTIGRREPERVSKEKGTPYQELPSTFGQGPKYSFRGKPKDHILETSPGPSYMPPPFGKDAPSSTFHMKRDLRGSNEKSGPGPGEYSLPSTVGNDSKKFTMKGRIFPPDEGQVVSPGPAQYDPNYDPTLPSTHVTTFHARGPDPKPKDPGPGPGLYQIPSTMKKSAPTFHGRTPLHTTDTSPGPAAYVYEDTIGKDARKFTMRPRIETRSQVLSVPYYDYKPTFGEGRKSSFHGRAPEPKAEATPGPNYMPPTFGSDSRKFSFGNRREARSSSAASPGPAAYDLGSTIGTGPKFTLKGREKIPEEKNVNPGPAQYSPDYDKLMAGRKSEIGRRWTEKEDTTAGKYYLLPDPDKGPMFTIGRRDPLEVAPGPK